MSKFKVGEKALLNGGCCPGATVKITDLRDEGYHFKVLTTPISGYEEHECWEDAKYFERLEKTMDNLQVGDVLERDGMPYTKEVQGTMGKVVFTCDSDDDNSNCASVAELKAGGWKLKDTSESKEMTVSEVSKALGHEVKIIKD